MHIRHGILYALVFFLVASLSSCAPGGAGMNRDRPNVILIMTDDQGYGDIGAHGNPYLKTPNLDALHGQSVRFTNFHTDPSCSPTRAAIMTGQYSARSGVWHTIGGRSLLKKGKTTMAEVFAASGYRTGYFGKWHLGENYPFRPMDRGFQETVVHGGGASSIHPDYWGNDYYDDVYKHNGVFKRYEGFCNTVWFNEALKFIEANREQPFFAYISTNSPHAPLLVDEEYCAPYKSMVPERIANYYGMITQFDEDLGKFLAELDRLKLTENTILIYMTDNGPCPWFGGIMLDDSLYVDKGYSAGMRGAKIRGYEGAHRVPFFIRWPAAGIGGGKDVDKLAAHFDILPTLIDLAGLQAPRELRVDGVSLRPLMEDPKAPWNERTLFVHNQRVQDPEKYKDFIVLTEEWRLEHYGKEELYHIRTDTGEVHNVANQHPDIVKDLRARYEAWWEDVSEGFDEYNDIIIGNDRDNPSTLYAHDALRGRDGYVWAVDVDQEGVYEFNVYRWPVESGRRVLDNEGPDFRHNLLPTSTTETNRFGLDEGTIVKPASIKTAHLAIGNLQREVEVTPSTTASTFVVQLASGETSLQAWFSGDRRYQANYVSVRRVGPIPVGGVANYRPVLPEEVIRNYE